ncbi:MAG: hypothetical protein GX607_03055 [Myxococcales bacterium]|jgi:hypothetical protein|nr:hypothetical protein [Myxococcales bacterium]
MSRNRGAELGREAHHWMLLSAASIFLCGSCVSIAAVLLCYMAQQDARRDALAEATAHLRWGKRVTIGGVFLSALGGSLVLALRTLA